MPTTEELLELRKRMLVHAARHQNSDPEEIAQEYVLRLIEGLHEKATVGQAYIDIMRTKANSRSKFYEQIKAVNITTAEFDPRVHDGPELPGASMEDRLNISKYIFKLKKYRSQHVIREWMRGCTLKEIAAQLEITESRVSQIHHLALRELRVLLERGL